MKSIQLYIKALSLIGAPMLIALIAALLLSAPPVAGHQVDSLPTAPQVEASIWLRSPAGQIEVDTQISITVALSDVVDMYGLDLVLAFPADKLQVVDANPGQAGIQSTPADCPVAANPSGFVIQNTANNTLGTLRYSVTQLDPTPPVTGDCDVLHIHFLTTDGPTALLAFDEVTLADSEGSVIPVTLHSRELTIETEKLVFLPLLIK
ncbi:MAG: cohesin domain-containing protein [Candidatus Promineifilaceae bacterium]|nr:cohesin domain-containing protein [Candidatus Promineifilaceae bacterium]